MKWGEHMHKALKIIMDSVSPAWGVCTFECEGLIKCAGLSRLPKGAKSVIAALFPYYLGESSYEGSNVSRYAVVPDYHGVIAQRLGKAAALLREEFPDELFEYFTDNSPLPEVNTAVRAGLGVKGRNGLLINPQFGSWVFIGEIVSTMKLEPSPPAGKECINCSICIKNCPTGALSEDGVDKSLCLSDITQRKGELTLEQKRLIALGGCAWGCDICQKFCPLNSKARVSPIEEFRNGARPRASIGEDISGRAYAWRGREVIERNLKLLDE
jgi:epoxyqueuosine reductase QueG